MNTKSNRPLMIAFVVVVLLFFFGGWGMMGGGMNGSGWMGDRSWAWPSTLVTLIIGVVLGWIILKKND